MLEQTDRQDGNRRNGLPQLLVLVPHEPTLDPRVHYTAESLAKGHVVTVVATVQDSESRPQDSYPAHTTYATVRIPYEKRGAIQMCCAYMNIWARQLLDESLLAWMLRLVFGALAFILLGVSMSVIVPLGLVLELSLLIILLPVGLLVGLLRILDSGPFFFLPLILRIIRRLTRGALSAIRLPRLDRGSLYRGLRIALGVLRFTFQANYLLWRYATGKGLVPDLVYCHDLYSLQAGVMLKRRYGARLIYDSHEFYPYQYQFRYYAPLIRLYESQLVREVDVYITVSPQLAGELGRTYRVGPVHFIPNVEPYPAPRPKPVVSQMSSLADGRLKLLYQGNFAEGRGLEEVVREWSKVDGSKIALFLRGPRNVWRDHLERLAEERSLLGKSVYVLPPVLEKDLIGAAQEADVGLLPYKGDWPSYRFACPNKLSQYIHAGLALLANRLAYVEQLINQGEIGLCYDVHEDGSFARAVGLMAENRSMVEGFKKNALAFSEKEYNWERYENLLLRLVDGA